MYPHSITKPPKTKRRRAAWYFQHALALDFWPPPRTQTQQRQRATQHPYLLRVPRGRPRQSLQPPPILRMQTLIPVRQLALAHYVPLRRQPTPVHPVVIAVVPLRLRQPLVQPQKSLPTAVANLKKVHALPAIRQLNHRRPNPHLLPLLTAPRPMISPHLVKGNRRRYAPPLALHRYPNPNAQGPPDFFDPFVHGAQIDLQNPADGGYGHAFAVQINGLFLDLFRVVVAVAVGSEAVVAEAAAAGLLARERPSSGSRLEPQWGRWRTSRQERVAAMGSPPAMAKSSPNYITSTC